MAGLNLLAAIIIYWNTDQLGKAVAHRKRAGWAVLQRFLHTSHPSDGHISSSQASTGGQNDEIASLA
jgi:hypothetical protein